MLLLDTVLIYSINFKIRLPIRIDSSALLLFLSYFTRYNMAQQSKMDNQKANESAGSSSGDIPGRANSKTEKTHQKITLPTFEKCGIQEAKLWLRQFTQYTKMTQNIDLNTMTTDREILENYRDDLEHRIKDLFI